MTPRQLAEAATPRLRIEFEKVFAEHEGEFESNYNRDDLRRWVLGYIAKAIWDASQQKGERRIEHGGST